MTALGSENGGVLHGLDTESREMVLDMVGQLRKRLLPREKILEFDRKEIFPEEIIREMLGPDIGLQLLFIPEAYGGMGGGARDCCAITRKMSGICLGIATALFAIQLGTDPIMVGGTEAQKEKWLGAIAEGNTLVAYGVTEPGAGSDVARIRTKAEPVSDDAGTITGYRINGNKQFISNGGYADLVTILAQTPEGPSFFVVEKEREGFILGKGEEKHGIRASDTSPITLDNVLVPAENLIGEVPGKGLKQANKVFGYTRLMVASMALGAGEAALDIAIAYAKERIQFGTPLSEKQGYTHKLIVPHAVRFEAATAYLDEVALRLDSSETDLQVEGAIAKLFTTEAANRAADDAIQALGGYGYISEFEVEKIRRDVKITCIYEGTSEIQQSIVSTFRWKTTRKTKGAYYNDICTEMEQSETGDAGCGIYALAAKTLNQIITLVHDNKLVRQQHVMFTLADMMTSLEVGASLARKARTLTENEDPLAEKLNAMSRIFANETAQVFFQNVPKILVGSGVMDQKSISDVMDAESYKKLISSYRNLIQDMDKVADMLFER